MKETYVTHFKDLGIAGTILRAVEAEGYQTPTPIQAQAIPPLMAGRDLLGIAQTGTGKTAAFALPILHRLTTDRRPVQSRRVRALVLAPTRELAAQIGESFRTYGRNAHMQIAVIFGGVSYGPQVKALNRGLDILVATPGRLLDHLEQGTLRLDATDTIVLDEADHMLDLGFIAPIRNIVARLPKRRQTLLFSATMPKEIAKLAADMLNDPVEVSVKPAGATADRISQCVYHVAGPAKTALLAQLLARKSVERAIVFTRTKRGADRVAVALGKSDIASVAIHGNKSQGQREKALALFRNGKARVMVATDIAARGIDIDGITHVVNYELPDVPEAYVHRIGRTARAGADGEGIAFCAPEERPNLRAIERLTGQKIQAFAWDEGKGLAPFVTTDEQPATASTGAEKSKRQRSAQKRKPFDASGNPRKKKQFNDGKSNIETASEKRDRHAKPAPRNGDSPARMTAGAASFAQATAVASSTDKRHRNRAGQRRRRRMAAEANGQQAMA